MKKFFIIFALIFIVFSSQIFAEENLKEEYCSSAVGFNQQFNLSGAYTMGLTYQNYFDNNCGIQASLGAIVNETVYYSADIQLQRLFLVNNFLNKRKTSLFGWANIGITVDEKAHTIRDEDGTPLETTFTDSPALLVGAGFGIEFVLFDHVSIPLKFGVTSQFITNPGVGLSLGYGILYRF